MIVLKEKETNRLKIQELCDSAKSSEERNRLGQFATPTGLANDILAHAKTFFSNTDNVRFLDPAIGTGSFYAALLNNFSAKQIKFAQGYEIDAHYADPAIKLWADNPLNIDICDFTIAIPPQKKFNLIISNPPYVRHHHIDAETKSRLKSIVKETLGLEPSGLSGLYCYFLLIAHEWLADDGIAGWLIPSEFMDVNYGTAVKEYLLSKVELIQIHRFDPSEPQFDDAIVSSCVVWFRKKKPIPDHSVIFTFGGTLAAPKHRKVISAKELKKEKKWSRFPEANIRAKNDGAKLADFFTIKRGIATGNNNFFILSREEIKKQNLPMKFFRPVLPGPRYVSTGEITSDSKGLPQIDRQLFLLDCRLSEIEIEKDYPTLWKYLDSGKETVAKQYLSKHRTPWYAQENRLPAPFLFTYMGRSVSGSSPFRFILNSSKATVTNSYLVLYPKGDLASICEANPASTRKIWTMLNKLAAKTLMEEGRVYGGGLYKMEPKELANVPVLEIADFVSKGR